MKWSKKDTAELVCIIIVSITASILTNIALW